MKLLSIIILLPFAVVVPNKKEMALVKENLYFDKNEVSNAAWRVFETELINKGEDVAKYRHNDVWTFGGFNKYYYPSEGFGHFPVVGITHYGATEYCKWKNNKSEVKGTYRLPTKREFLYAMRAGEQSKKWQRKKQKMSKRYYPTPLYNFRTVENPQCTTTSMNSNMPDKFGIHNLKGNVSELVQEKNIALGGSWKDRDDKNWYKEEQIVNSPQDWVGFRCVCELN